MAMLECKCCKGCEERHVRCHSDCEEYREFREAKDRENAKIRIEKEKEMLKRKKRW